MSDFFTKNRVKTTLPVGVVVVLVLLAMVGGAGADMWESNTTIVGGLVSVTGHAFPEVFQKDGTWYLIAGVDYGDFDGFNWTGSTWQSDTAMGGGLGSLAYYSSPTVFEKDGTWYLISGENSGTFYGFNWTGSTWQSDTDIVSGLGDIGGFSAPTVFQTGSTWYLISGEHSGTFYGFNWTGSTWQSDTDIVSGLGDVGGYSAPTAFQKGSTWYLISGEHSGTFYGFNWTGSTWQSDTDVVGGLGDVGDYSTPTVFNMGSVWYLIGGESGEGGGAFNGYNTTALSTPSPTSLAHVKNMFWVNHSWVAGSGVATDTYNVSINGTWHNGTTNTYYNNTLTTFGDWSNATVYAYGIAGGLSSGSVSEDVQLPYSIPATPTGAGSTWDYYWVNHTWTEGSSYGVWCGDTDSYNVSVNDTWHNATTNTYYNNTGLPPHGWSNTSIYAFNNTAGVNETYIYQHVQMANQAITITNTSDWSGGAGGVVVYVDYDATDPDGDTPIFSCNRTDMFADFDTATGIGHWTAVEGIYYVGFGVSDGWGSIDNYTMTITVWAGAVDMWVSNATIISGLGDVGAASAPTVFEMGGTWYLISGEGESVFNGYRWTGSTWQSNATIISGLDDGGEQSKPTVFEMGGTWYLISGRWNGAFDGYSWTGSTWQSDAAIISGLSDVGYNSAPNVFQMYGVWYLISGETDGVFNGYRWTGSTWQSDAAIISGLSDVGSASIPTVSQLGGWYLISGEFDGVFNGYRWTGSTWQSNAEIISGLGDVGTHSSPITFQMYDVWYLISGEGGGAFYGYHLVSDAPKNLTHTTGFYWVNHTWEAGDGAPAASYNVSINDVWHNTTTTYYNDTSPDDWGQWSNISVWGYNPVVGMSEMDVSDRVQIMPTLTPYNDFTSDDQVVLSPSDRHIHIEFKCMSDANVKTWVWSGVDTSSGTSNSIETTATKYLNSWKGTVSVVASNDYGTTEAMAWSFDITPPSYWFDPYYGQRDPILVISSCVDAPAFYYVEMDVDTTNCAYSDCRDLFFYDPRYGVLPFYTSRGDGVVQRTTAETIYVQMQMLTPGEQTIYMYSQCGENGVLRTNQFGGHAIIPNVGGVEKEFYCNPPCDDSEDVYTCTGGSNMMVWVNESASCVFKHLSGDVGSGVTWSCSDICDVGHLYIFEAGTGTACVAYDQDLLLIQPWGAGVGLYLKSSKTLWASEDSCWVGIGGHNTHIPSSTGSYSFSIGGGLTGINTRLGVYRSWQSESSARARIYELYYIVSQDPNPCGVATIFRYHDYMLVVLYDGSGNLIPGANVAIYDTTANTHIQKWETEDDGIITFQVEDYSGHTMQIAVKTFDGVFMHDVYIAPDGGLTNITIPINYNLNIHPEDQTGTPLTDVFCGLSEYTPLNPQSFWGFSMGGRQYVPITNCSGFAMCDIYAEKGGYRDYEATAINWTSRSAMIKDYRHDVVMAIE